MEYMGHTQTASYTIPRHVPSAGRQGSTSGLPPTLSNLPSSFKTYRSFPAPPITVSQTGTGVWGEGSGGYEGEYDTMAGEIAGMTMSSGGLQRLGELDSIKVPNQFKVVRNDPDTKFLPEDWRKSNSANLCASDRVRGGAELSRADAIRLCREVDDKSRKMQDESTKRLEDRIGDTAYWKAEIQAELDAMNATNQELEKMFGCVDKALLEAEVPLDIARRCLAEREKRCGIDLVHDDVEKELLKEVETILQIQDDLRQHVHDAKDQYELNCAAQRELQRDSGEKFAAMGLDTKCHGMRDNSAGLRSFSAGDVIDNTICDPEAWARATNERILRSQRMRTASKTVSDNIQLLLQRAAETLTNQWNAVNAAFTVRIKEYMEAKDRLQTHLSEVVKEMADTEKSLALLRKCLADKDGPMKVAQTRLLTRTERPNMEACRDSAHHRLLMEVQEVGLSADQLVAKIHEGEDAQRQLLRTKLALESDLAVKNQSLHIDREVCMGLRKSFVMKPRVYTTITFN